MKSIASSHGDDITKVVLSWALQRDVLILPRSTSYQHMQSNIQFMQSNHLNGEENDENNMNVFLSREELELIDGLDGCIDMHSECSSWAASGECDKNPAYMHQSCCSACGTGSATPLTCETLHQIKEDGDEL